MRADGRLVIAAVVLTSALAGAHHLGTLDRSRIGPGRGVTDLALDASGRSLWVACWNALAIERLDGESGRTLERFSTGGRPFALATLSQGGGLVHVPRYSSRVCLATRGDDGRVAQRCDPVAESVLEPEAGTKPLGPEVLALGVDAADRVVAAVGWRRKAEYFLWGLVRLERDGALLRPVAASPRRAENFYPRARGLVGSDTSSGDVFVAVPPLATLFRFDARLAPIDERVLASDPSALAIDAARGRIYLAFEKSGEVVALDRAGLELRAGGRIGHGPVALALRPDGRALWVLLRHDRAVVEVDPATLKPLRRIELPSQPWSMAPDWIRSTLWIGEPDRDRVASLSIAETSPRN